MKYNFNGSFFDTMQDAEVAVINTHPETPKDDLPDLFNEVIEVIETCPICGSLVYVSSWGGGVCSRRCWEELYGEP